MHNKNIQRELQVEGKLKACINTQTQYYYTNMHGNTYNTMHLSGNIQLHAGLLAITDYQTNTFFFPKSNIEVLFSWSKGNYKDIRN